MNIVNKLYRAQGLTKKEFTNKLEVIATLELF